MAEPLSRLEADCPLCEASEGRSVWSNANWNVVGIDDGEFPAYYRVIARKHIREFSELDPAEREECMRLVAAVESVLIKELRPTKINLASLGNAVPHLHWHIIARFDWDSRFPNSIWGSLEREVIPPPIDRLAAALVDLDLAVRSALPAARADPYPILQ